MRLRVAAVGRLAPLTLDAEQTSASAVAQDWVFEPLARVTSAGKLSSGLASRLERLPDGSWRMQLRPDARFSDGSPVTDADVIASLEARQSGLLIHREGEWLIFAPRIKGSRAEGALTVSAIGKRTAGGWLGTGPFVVVEQSPNRMLLRRARPAGPRRIESVELLKFDSIGEAFARTLAGEADALPIVPSRMVEFFDGVPNLQVIRGPDPSKIGVNFDGRNVDLPTRLALRADLPHSDLRELGIREGCEPLQDSAQPRPLPPGPPLEVLSIAEDPITERFALGLRRFLGVRSATGPDSSRRPTGREIIRQIGQGRTQVVVRRYLSLPSAMLAEYFDSRSGNNLLHYSNPAADAAFDREDWQGAEAALALDPPVVFLCTPERVAVVDARFTNARVGPWGLFESLPDWEAAP